MKPFLPCEYAFSDSISAVSKVSPHVPGPSGEVVEQQARFAVPTEPLPADSVCREAFQCAVSKRYNANRHPGDSDQQSWKRQGAGRDEQGKRKTDLKCRTLLHYLFSPSKRTDFSLLHCVTRKRSPAPLGWLHPDFRSDGPPKVRARHFRQDLQ